MLFSIALILLCGLITGGLCKKIRLPSLVGMIFTGILLGPFAMNLIDSKILDISTELRRIALIIILMRAGLSLDLAGLKKVGRPAILMCFVPAAFELAGCVVVAPLLLDISYLDAAIIGSVLAAVSPAVIVPRMIKLTEENYGTEKHIPQMILAGASVDDVFVIVMFTAFTGIARGQDFSFLEIAKIPCSIILGILAGFLTGIVSGKIFGKIHIRDSVKVIILLSIAFLLNFIEERFGKTVPFSGLIAIMASGCGLQKTRQEVSVRLSSKFNKLWVFSEIILFVLVGATVNIEYAYQAGITAVAAVFLILIFRIAGVFICVLGTNLNPREKLFCAISYIPKATVQAAIGGIPLSLGLSCGNTVLTVAVLAILITAPLGAFLIDIFYKRLLTKKVEDSENQG